MLVQKVLAIASMVGTTAALQTDSITAQPDPAKTSSTIFEGADQKMKQNDIKRVAVYCGSSTGKGDVYIEQGQAVGKFLATRGIEIVYGGGGSGLMGTVARSALEHGGKVHGVICEWLTPFQDDKYSLTSLTIVKDMHARKKKMFRMADAIIALPGGPGTLDEFCELLAWCSLSIHDKPMALLNVNGYYAKIIPLLQNFPFIGFLSNQDYGQGRESIFDEFFLEPEQPGLPNLESLWQQMLMYQPPARRFDAFFGSSRLHREDTSVDDPRCVINQNLWQATNYEENEKRVIKKVCIFLGSNPGKDDALLEVTQNVGVEVIYGGGDAGLMGVLANSVIENNGKVHAVTTIWMPESQGGKEFDDKLTSLQKTPDMHTRKKIMFAMCDAFLVLPGGVGTLDEFGDMFVLSNLSQHTKAIGLLDVDRYWSTTIPPLFQSYVEHGFMAPGVFERICRCDTDLEKLWHEMNEYEAPPRRFDGNIQLPEVESKTESSK